MRMLALLLAGIGLMAAPPPRAPDAPVPSDVHEVVRAFSRGSAPALTSYRAVRHLSASTRGGRMRAAVTARTELDPEHGFRFDVIAADGSPLLQRKVLLAALEAERALQTGGGAGNGALTGENYTFSAGAPAEAELVRVDLKPRRKDTLLVDGAMFLTPGDFDLVRVEGVLVKRPSFWTRRVEVVRRYGRVAGVRVPLSMESTASVLIVGRSSFAMRYDYESINGVTVPATPDSPALPPG